MGDKEPCVHFSSTSGVGYNNIVIQPLKHGHLNVHLGFLQIYHRYHIEFTIPWFTCVLHTEGAPPEPAMLASEPNPHCLVIDFTQKDKDNLRLKIELLAAKERFLKEIFQIKCCETGAPLTIYLNARVFGKDQGTPLLRNGIRSIAIEDDHSKDEDDEEDDDDEDDDTTLDQENPQKMPIEK